MTKALMTPADVATGRFNLIAPLVSDGLDKGRRYDLMHEIAEKNGVSERTLRRYLSAWEEGGYDALKPKQGWERQDSRLGDWFDQVVVAAIELRRESPSRSVADIIKILELEHMILPGEVARSTLQRHLAIKGYASSQMRMYVAKGTAARRFQKEHRNQLWQSDIKVGPFVKGDDGKAKQIYLVVWIDDCTRFVPSARFYTNQTISALEDSLRTGVQKFGAPDRIFVDNGKQFRSNWLSETCAKLGIRLLTARPYHPEAKGKVEMFNRLADRFLSEAALAKLPALGDYNEYLRIWIDEYYHARPHSALSGSVSPATAFNADARPLRFATADQLQDAFLHTDTRKVDKAGCISFAGQHYEVGIAYIGRRVGIRFDPSWTDELEILPEQSAPFVAKKLAIGENTGVARELPEHMRAVPPDRSRMFDGLKNAYLSRHRPLEAATTFKAFWEGDIEDV